MPRRDVEARRKYQRQRYLKNRDKIKAATRAYYYKNIEKCRAANQARSQAHAVERRAVERARYYTKRDSILYSKYGIREDDVAKLLEIQGGGCALCGEIKLLGVDHCHQTGKVRGILCRKCNGGIGLLRDDPKMLVKAYKYLTDRELRDMFVADEEPSNV